MPITLSKDKVSPGCTWQDLNTPTSEACEAIITNQGIGNS